MPGPVSLHRSSRTDRLIVSLSLAGVTSSAWLTTIYLAWPIHSPPKARPQVWGPVELGLLFLMWVIMMIAMMMPSAWPMIGRYARTLRSRGGNPGVRAGTALFVLGYIAIWSGFSLCATVVQWGLHTVALPSVPVVGSAMTWGGAVLIAAGVFQWLPFKHGCLRRCRSPLGFLLAEWRDGARGAWVMGLRHGLFCVGCCGALMALLFVVGVMNLFWIVALAVFVWLEKTAPGGARLAKGAGGVMIASGILIIAFGGPAPA